MVQANGIDLSLFQFDYDLTFAAFFMNADRTIYGRYGTNPSQENPGRDISLQGFIASLEAALKLHGNYPEGKEALLHACVIVNQISAGRAQTLYSTDFGRQDER